MMLFTRSLGLTLIMTAMIGLSGYVVSGPSETRHGQELIPEARIGSQTWMSANLAVSQFRNGDPIRFATNREEWMEAWENKEPAYCCYDDDPAKGEKYGFLYNWWAVDDERGLSPEGWRVPSDNDWKKLEMKLGMSEADADATSYRGKKEATLLKSIEGWTKEKGKNTTGFNAMPAGARSAMGWFNESEGNSAAFWTSTSSEKNQAFGRQLKVKEKGIGRWDSPKATGMSVRCLKE